jgi:hypothetical protein
MQLDAKEIFEISNKFNGIFFLLLKENNSFLNTLLGLLYSSQTMVGITERLKIATKEELEKMQVEMVKAAGNNLDANMELIGDVIKELEANNWEVGNEKR